MRRRPRAMALLATVCCVLLAVGLVFVAVASETYSHVSRLFIDRHDADARNLIRHFAALKALSLILRAAGYYKD